MKWELFMSKNKASSGENNMAKVMDARESYSLFAYQFTYSKLEKLGMDFQNKFQNLYYKFDGRFIYLFLLYFFKFTNIFYKREGEHLGLKISKFVKIFSSDEISSWQNSYLLKQREATRVVMLSIRILTVCLDETSTTATWKKRTILSNLKIMHHTCIVMSRYKYKWNQNFHEST